VTAEITEDLVLPFGSASGDTDGSADAVDTSLVQSAHAEGQATGDGFVDVLLLTDGSMFLENTGPSDLELSFQLDFAMSAAASVDSFLFEDALAFASVELLGTGAFAEPGAFESSLFFFDVLADGLFGPPTDDDIGSVDFSLSLPAASSGELLLFVDATGFADSFVPEPATSSLLALALVTLAAFRRRR
jgi:hypothetical protein